MRACACVHCVHVRTCAYVYQNSVIKVARLCAYKYVTMKMIMIAYCSCNVRYAAKRKRERESESEREREQATIDRQDHAICFKP